MQAKFLMITTAAALMLAAGVFMSGCAIAPSSHPMTAAETAQSEAQNREFHRRLVYYYSHTTPQQRAADERQAALNRIAWAQEQIASSQRQAAQQQQQAIEQQQRFYQQQQLDSIQTATPVPQQHYYSGQVNEDGSVQLYGY